MSGSKLQLSVGNSALLVAAPVSREGFSIRRYEVAVSTPKFHQRPVAKRELPMTRYPASAAESQADSRAGAQGCPPNRLSRNPTAIGCAADCLRRRQTQPNGFYEYATKRCPTAMTALVLPVFPADTERGGRARRQFEVRISTG